MMAKVRRFSTSCVLNSSTTMTPLGNRKAG
jgi:hypothetical protein